MNKNIEIFLDKVCGFVKCKSVHKDIKSELSAHIEDIVHGYTDNGMSEEEAVSKAILQMGDASSIGNALNKQHRPYTEWVIIALTFIITMFGAVIMYISSGFENQTGMFEKHVIYTILGAIVLIFTYFCDYTKLKKYPWLIYTAGFVLTILSLFSGVAVNGAKRWLCIGPITFSTSIVSSVLFIIAFAGLTDKYRNCGASGVLKLVLTGVVSLIPLIMMPSLSSVIILVIVYACVLIKAVLKKHFGSNVTGQIIVLASTAVFGIFIMISALFTSGYQYERLRVFMSGGKSDPNGIGWIQVMVEKCLNSSHWIGAADGMAGSADILPGITGEYVLINIITHLGIAAGIAVVLTILLFIIRLFFTAGKINNSFGYYLSLSCCVYLTVQFVISILINFNFFPLTAISMPFVSYGGSCNTVCMFVVGMILSARRRNNIIPKESYRDEARKKMIFFSDGRIVIDLNTKR